MVIWRGKGWLTLFILVGCLYGVPAGWRYLHGERNLPSLWVKHYDSVMASSLVIAGVLLIGIGLYLNRNRQRMLFDPATGRNLRAGAQHTLYYLAMEWWGAAALGGGLFMLYRYASAPPG